MKSKYSRKSRLQVLQTATARETRRNFLATSSSKPVASIPTAQSLPPVQQLQPKLPHLPREQTKKQLPPLSFSRSSPSASSVTPSPKSTAPTQRPNYPGVAEQQTTFWAAPHSWAAVKCNGQWTSCGCPNCYVVPSRASQNEAGQSQRQPRRSSGSAARIAGQWRIPVEEAAELKRTFDMQQNTDEPDETDRRIASRWKISLFDAQELKYAFDSQQSEQPTKNLPMRARLRSLLCITG